MKPRADLGRSADAYFNSVEPELKALANELRALVLKSMPQAEEMIKWGVPCYVLPGHKMWTCSIRENKAHITLQFGESGTQLPDPDGLLEGTGKALRHLKLRPGADFPKKTIGSWIKWAVRNELAG